MAELVATSALTVAVAVVEQMRSAAIWLLMMPVTVVQACKIITIEIITIGPVVAAVLHMLTATVVLEESVVVALAQEVHLVVELLEVVGQ